MLLLLLQGLLLPEDRGSEGGAASGLAQLRGSSKLLLLLLLLLLHATGFAKEAQAASVCLFVFSLSIKEAAERQKEEMETQSRPWGTSETDAKHKNATSASCCSPRV